MYIAYGWPRVLAAPLPGAGRHIALAADAEHCVGVSEWGVCVWTGGQVRLRLGEHALAGEEADAYGQHVAAEWCAERGCVAALTARGWLLIYGLHPLKQPLLPPARAGGPHWSGQERLAALRGVDVYIKHATRCAHDAPPTALACSGLSILVAYADGYVGSASWGGKMRPELFDVLPDAADEQPGPHRHPAGGSGVGAAAAVAAANAQRRGLPGSAVVSLAYSEAARLAALVFADGSAALYAPAPRESGGLLHPQLDFQRWLAGPAARVTAAQLAPAAQLIALGTASGAVHLLRLHPPAPDGSGRSGGGEEASPDLGAVLSLRTSSSSTPRAADLARAGSGTLPGPAAAEAAGLAPEQLVRTLELGDWGHTPAQTGGVAALSWAPDCRALAVGFGRQGLVVWTPSGCRLLCTLRQPAPETPRVRAPSEASGAAAPWPATNGAGEEQQRAAQQPWPPPVSVDGAVDCLAWGPGGYQLLLASRPSGGGGGGGGSTVCELALAKSLAHHHRVCHVAPPDAAGAGGGLGVAQLGEELHVMQGADRLLLVTEALTGAGPGGFVGAGMGGGEPGEPGPGGSDLAVHHVPLPGSYSAANWPLRHAAVSPCGGDIAAAGRQGLAVFNRRAERWRLFGDVSQERRVSCIALGWLGDLVVACSCAPAPGAADGGSAAAAAAAAATAAAAAAAAAAASGAELSIGAGAGFRCQLLLFPRNHLDLSSVVASHTLAKVPLAMDCTEQHILLASAPLQLLLLQLQGGGAGGGGRPPASGGAARLVAVRELSLFNVGRPVAGVALVPAAAAEMAKRVLPDGTLRPPSACGLPAPGRHAPSPCHAVLLRWGGLMSVLDLTRGRELVLADEVDTFWLSDTLPVAPGGAQSSRAGSTSASAAHSRASSMANLAGMGGEPHSGAGGAEAGGGGLQAAWDAAMAGLTDGGAGGEPRALGAGIEGARAQAHAGGVATPAPERARRRRACLQPPRRLTPPPPPPRAGGAPEVVEMPWWAYGPVGMQLWFPSLVLAAMACPPHSSSSGGLLAPQASLPAQLSPQGSTPGALAASLGPSTPRAPAAAGGTALPHARSAPALAGAGAAGAPGGAPGPVGGGLASGPGGVIEMELEFDREVWPIGVSLADASLVGVTQRVLRPAPAPGGGQAVSPRRRSSSGGGRGAAAKQPAAGAGAGAASAAAGGGGGLGLPFFLPVPESQPVLPALLRRLLQQGALPEALALAGRHEGGPHFTRSLEWLLFTTLDMEAPKCRPGRRSGGVPGGARPGGGGTPRAGAFAGVLGRQGKGWQGHVERHVVPVPVTPLLAAAVELVLSFPQCLGVVVSVSRKTDASLWPALFSAVGSPAALLELLLDSGALASAACFLIVVDRLEGAALAQGYALSLVAAALRRGQFYLVAEILRFLIPPRESSSGVVQWGPAAPAPAPAPAPEQQAPQAAAQQAEAQAAAPASGGGSWLGWLWGGGGGGGAQQAQQAAHAGDQGVLTPRVGSMSAAGHYRQSLAGAGSGVEWQGLSGGGTAAAAGAAPGGDACRVVAERGWALLEQGKLVSLAQLSGAMAFLTGGLAGVMAAFRPAAGAGAAAAAAATAEAPPSAGELLDAVGVAVEELPVWESAEVEADAAGLLDLCRALGARCWALALAVLLVDVSVLAPYAAEAPHEWAAFCGRLAAAPQLYFLHDVVAALTGPGPGGPGGGPGGDPGEPGGGGGLGAAQVLMLDGGLSLRTMRASGGDDDASSGDGAPWRAL
ncbi:R06F6.8 [Scenedesmus sp. PABB004]|nr:R06F6.8 [Scenedesmus sp. PABB004]